MNQDIKLLNRGILPDSLKFNRQQEELDLNKVAYNLRYKDTNYWLNKFPPGFENLPGSEKVLEQIAQKALTPLEELNLRNSNNCFTFDEFLKEFPENENKYIPIDSSER